MLPGRGLSHLWETRYSSMLITGRKPLSGTIMNNSQLVSSRAVARPFRVMGGAA